MKRPEPWPPPPDRRATDHEGKTLFGDEERSRLRAVHEADLYRVAGRKGLWVGIWIGAPVGAALWAFGAWLTEVLR